MKIKQIIFDFDWLILNSHNVKTKGFYKLFQNYGNLIAKKAESYHLKNVGVSRFKKFKFILNNYLNEKITKIKLENLSKKFNKICLKEIYKLKIPYPLKIFLMKNHKNFDFYISTATPELEIRKIAKRIKINKYFKKIYGSPRTKVSHIINIKKNKKKTIFIGDSYEDYKSSKKTNTKFILKLHRENKKIYFPKNVVKIKNFTNLISKINSLD